MNQQFQRLKEILAEVYDLKAASYVLGWDMETYMPRAGTPTRADQLATLELVAHRRFTSPEVGELLAALEAQVAHLEPESFEASLVRVTRREYDKAVRLPPDLVAAFARATSLGQMEWKRAREENNFAIFQPTLAELVRLTRERAEALGYAENRYDALVNLHEPGLKTSQLEALFADLRATLVPLVQAIRERRDRVDDSVLYREYDEEKQWDACVEALKVIGFDFARGRMDRSVHPFCSAFSSHDVRLTNRFRRDFLSMSLFGALHEGGHGLYEQGIPEEFRRTPLGEAASMGMHESQSRLWENMVGRSREFWEYFLPRLKAFFPAQLDGVTVEAFYRAVNRSEPSLIRTEADEVTYNLHIMIRFELERALLDGQLAVQDLPEAWNEKYRSYLGITPPDLRSGVLQDIHWSGGMFGYFPSYTLGNVIAAQLYETALRDHPEIPEQIRQGRTGTLLDWMRRHVHVHGAKLTPSELLMKATGRDMTAEPYLRYITNKYSEIYGL